jgi:hypothetical protein
VTLRFKVKRQFKVQGEKTVQRFKVKRQFKVQKFKVQGKTLFKVQTCPK